MREVFLNKSLVFDEWRDRFILLAEKYHLRDSGYLKLHPFPVYQEMWLNHKLEVWGIGMDTDVAPAAPASYLA